MFLGEHGEETVPVLVMKDQQSGAMWATWVPSKGVEHPWVVKRVVMWIESLGHKKIILKSDQEPSIQAVQAAVKEGRSSETILENSPVGESRSNGLTEKAVQEVQGMVRTIKDHMDQKLTRWKKEGDDDAEVSGAELAWMITHAANLITRYKVGQDGRTSYQRLKGKRCSHLALPFGEKM
eukprot:8188391-Karenia_brevis.AAC.1